MKLKTFTSEDLAMTRSTAPCVGINVKSGCVRFNQSACEKIGAKDKDQVVFHQDEEEPADWYMEFVKKDGICLRHKIKTSPTGLVLQSCALVKKIYDSISYTGLSGIMSIGEAVKLDKRTLWPLITAKIKNK